jgi:hypothetical protein
MGTNAQRLTEGKKVSVIFNLIAEGDFSILGNIYIIIKATVIHEMVKLFVFVGLVVLPIHDRRSDANRTWGRELFRNFENCQSKTSNKN